MSESYESTDSLILEQLSKLVELNEQILAELTQIKEGIDYQNKM